METGTPLRDLHGGSQRIRDVSKQLQRLTIAKRRQVRNRNFAYVAGHGKALEGKTTEGERKALLKTSERMLRCASWLKFRDFIEHGETRLVDARFCGRTVLCEACARRRAIQVGQTYVPKLEAALDAREGRIAALLTLTIRSTEDLRAGLELIRDSFRNLRMRGHRHRNNPDRHAYSESCKMAGGVAAIEVKRAKSKPGSLWHPHLHALVILDDYIDQKRLSDEWKVLTGGSYIVDIRRVRGDDVLDGVREALKYPVKFNDLSAADCVQAFLAIRGIRYGKSIHTLSSFGCVRAALPDLNDFDESTLSGAYLEWYAKWDSVRQVYNCENGRTVTGELVKAQAEAREANDWGEPEWIDAGGGSMKRGRAYELRVASEPKLA